MSIDPFVFSAEQLTLISKVCPDKAHIDPSVWSEDSIKSLKTAIKKHYIATQKSTCCYCNLHQTSENHRVWDIDHIVPRNTHPAFIFEVRNLIAACPDCNVAKGETQTLKNKLRKTYPGKSEDFRIIHPHFDEFDQHLHRVGNVYIPKTEKGSQTIIACNLLRFAQKYIKWPTSLSDVRFEDEIETVMDDGPDAAAAVQRLIDSLQT